MTTVTRSVDAVITADPSASCDTDLAASPWVFDLTPGYGPGASEDDVIPDPVVRPGQLPVDYQRMPDEELHARIRAAKETLGDRLVILGHFYQRDEVVQYADFVGDSFQLANAALTRPEAETIVFCGVHFMAETADILARPEQHVILPNLAAGCSMADMADEESVEAAWEELMELYADEEGDLASVIPVTYMNSSAALKAFCGRHGGIVCTSSNAATVLEWAFERGRRVLFFPDQHLGRNTGKAMGVPLEQMPMINPRKPGLGVEPQDEVAGLDGLALGDRQFGDDAGRAGGEHRALVGLGEARHADGARVLDARRTHDGDRVALFLDLRGVGPLRVGLFLCRTDGRELARRDPGSRGDKHGHGRELVKLELRHCRLIRFRDPPAHRASDGIGRSRLQTV